MKFVLPKYPLRKRISISFSGGKTSAYMTVMLLEHFRQHPEYEVVVVFANTGQEHEETLTFVDRCDREFGFDLVWIESVTHHGSRKGVGFRKTSYDFACRKGEPFQDYIQKYGIPNQNYNQCTSRLKTEPMDAFRKSIGWEKETYSTAIGIRADEIDRVSATALANGIFYPCADAGITKADVRDWWAKQSFNLNIPEHLGNCTWCWKKSKRKLMTLTQSHPEIFEFPRKMEKLYGMAGGQRRDKAEKKEPRVFFRGKMTVDDLFAEATQPFTPFDDEHFIPFDDDLDVGGGCGESCEIGADLPD